MEETIEQLAEMRTNINTERERITNLLPRLSDIELENNEQELQQLGFNSIDDYNFIKSIQEHINTFIEGVPNWEGLEARIPQITNSFIYIYLLRRGDIEI